MFFKLIIEETKKKKPKIYAHDPRYTSYTAQMHKGQINNNNNRKIIERKDKEMPNAHR